MNSELIKYFQVPVSQIPLIKQGADFTTADGEVIPNWQLTTPPTPSKSFAYCSDTAYTEKFLAHIDGVDCLFHEATFLQKDIAAAKKNAPLHGSASGYHRQDGAGEAIDHRSLFGPLRRSD